MEFSEVIKELRQRMGISQEKLAAKLKVSILTINRWEKKKTQPDALAMSAIETFIRKAGAGYFDLLKHCSALRDGKGSRRRRDESQNGEMDVKSMETLLWKAACSIRGEKDAPKFKDYILPLIFIKRLSDVFEDELARLTNDYGGEETARSVIEADHGIVRFYIPPEAMWTVVSGRRQHRWPAGKQPRCLGEQMTATVRAITRANPSLQGVIDIVDYNETRNGEREISDAAIGKVIELLSDPRYRLGLRDVEPDFLGRAYEYLLRKFAEGQGQSAGEFFTPREVGVLLANLIEPLQGEEIYDCCCGSAGLLIKAQLRLLEREPKIDKPLKLFGQEQTGSSFAIARMNMIVHDMQGEIVRGNSMTNPKFLDGSKLKRFDAIVTNPMWNQKTFMPADYENDPFERFAARGGFAPTSSADWAWLQNVHASLRETGRAAVVIDTGAASRGSGNEGDNKEKTIRAWFVENDLVDGVILLPDNLFYNTPAAGMIVVLNNAKPKDRRGKVVLINAAAEFTKGRPKNYLPEPAVTRIAAAYHAGKDIERFAKVVTKAEIVKNDYNLSPSRHVESATVTEHRDIQTLLNELAALEQQEQATDRELKTIFTKLGYRCG